MVNRLLLAVAALVALVAGSSTAGAATVSDAEPSTSTSAAPSETAAPPNGSTLTVGPALLDVSLNPGDRYEAPITLVNGSGSPVSISAAIETVPTPEGQSGNVGTAFDATSWFTVDRPQFELAAQSQTTVNLTVITPSEAEPGGHYATVFFAASPVGGASGNVAVNARVGVVALLTVNGDVRRQLALDPVLQAPGFSASPGDTVFRTQLSNGGTIHVAPMTQVVVEGWLRGEVARFEGPSATLLPGLSQTVDVTWDHGWWPGVYTARLDLVGADLGSSAVSKRFLVIPWPWFALPVAFVSLVPLFVLRRRRKRRERRARNRKLAQRVMGAHTPVDQDEMH